jgi:hypothetical protein
VSIAHPSLDGAVRVLDRHRSQCQFGWVIVDALLHAFKNIFRAINHLFRYFDPGGRYLIVGTITCSRNILKTKFLGDLNMHFIAS